MGRKTPNKQTNIYFLTYIDILQLPIVLKDITENTVANSVLSQSLVTAANKHVSVVNLGVTFLLDAILNKTASFKTEMKTFYSLIIFMIFLTLYF